MKKLVAKLKAVKRDVVALSFAVRDPRCPRAAKALAAVVLAYALSPLDLIPDFIPVIGILDDLILVPFGILLVERLVPAEVMAQARLQAQDRRIEKASNLGLAIVIFLWIAFIFIGFWLVRKLRHPH